VPLTVTDEQAARGSRIRFVMDPAGKQKHNGLSFYDLLATNSMKLRRRALDDPKAKGIICLADFLKDSLRLHDERRHATRQLLPTMTVEANRDGKRIKDCLAAYSFNEPGRNATGEPKPIHGDASHVVSAIEYAAVAIAYGFTDPKRAPGAKPNRRRPPVLQQQRVGSWMG
jgi:hypothetical protein